MKTMLKFCAGAVGALVACAALPASASTMFNIEFVDASSNVDLMATITTDGVANGVFGQDVIAISGNLVGPNFTNDAIAGLVADPSAPNAQVSADGLFIYDDNYDPTHASGVLVSNPGILFDSVGGVEYNLFSNANGSYTLYSAVNGQLSTFETGYIAVPEPVTWAMMALGIGLLGAGLRLGRAKPELAAA